ncbi:prolyl oligopeptidase family protein [Roseateles sp. BYS180W]|uniref:Prolyl oligopeptidase family protein n=1 Tax=Roseateles rivi TaxID=3299028 RepID=A0ABW7FZN2_9BURK
MFTATALGACAAGVPAWATQAPAEDPHLWLEEVQSPQALAWVAQRNKATLSELQADPLYTPLREQALELLTTQDRIPGVSRVGQDLYNLWTDEANPRGLWRRTTLEQFRQDKPQWEVVLDIDALGRAEGKSWVFHGASFAGPDNRRALLWLSPGGSDASVMREFDCVDKQFVKAGFELPEAKSQASWVDADTLLVGTDTGVGSLTDSGYPRTVRLWRRGTPLSEAPVVYEGQASDVSAGASVEERHGHAPRISFYRALDFYNSELCVWQGTVQELHALRPAQLKPLEIPSDVQVSLWGDWLLLRPRKDWKLPGQTLRSGSLASIGLKAFERGERRFTRLFEPSATRSLEALALTASCVLLQLNDMVASRVQEWRFGPKGPLRRREVKLPYPGSLSLQALHDPALAQDPLAEHYVVYYNDFLTPASLMLCRTGSDQRELLKRRAPQFDSSGMQVRQYLARSKDGTRVPYFVVSAKQMQRDGKNPCLLYGYGGFEASMLPGYSGVLGRGWLARGGVYVLANIRGGGEFGPAWHRAALRENRQRAYDDFIAVAEDLIQRRITSARHLGIQGGSNGGLLTGATFVQRPELFNAVLCQVPLLDMKRYHRLLAGASWMAEYGDPDQPEDWAYLQRYSPYHNVKKGKHYPRVFFTTSTKDDRVHPGHARKMVARMTEQGHEVLYYENTEGGHGGAADNDQRATLLALEYTYLWRQLGR